MRKAFLYIAVFLIVQVIAIYAVYTCDFMLQGKDFITAIKLSLLDAGKATPTLIIITSAVYSIILLVVFLKARWCEVSPSYLRTRPFGVLFWAGLAALGTLIPSEVFQELVPLKDLSSKTMMQVMASRWGYLTLCIFAPLVEEIVFRGAALRALLQGFGSKWVAIVVSALLFALVHINPAQMPHAFFMGLLLGWMYERTHSILPGVMMHWVNNTVVYVVFNLFPQLEDMTIVDLFGGDVKMLMLAVLFSLCIFVPSLVQLHLRMRPARHQ